MLIAFPAVGMAGHLTVITQERFAVCLFYANSLIVQRGRISDNESGTAGTATVNLLPSLKGNPPLGDGFLLSSLKGLKATPHNAKHRPSGCGMPSALQKCSAIHKVLPALFA